MRIEIPIDLFIDTYYVVCVYTHIHFTMVVVMINEKWVSDNWTWINLIISRIELKIEKMNEVANKYII